MENQTNNQITGFWEKSRMLFKGFMIGFLILVMLIPVAMLSELIKERERRQAEVTEEISSKWASSQTILGPAVIVPYLVKADSGKPAIRKNMYLLPEKLKINGQILPEVRHRSLYDVTLYRSGIALSGTFDPSYIGRLDIPSEDILWNEAQLIIGLDDARGLEDDVTLKWDSTRSILETGLPGNTITKDGLNSKVTLDANRKVEFAIDLKIKGSSHLYFTPVGKTTDVTLASSWKDPAFDGQYLPSRPANISDKGFNAQWKILQVSRSYPQAWKEPAEFDVYKSAFGVKLLQPTDGYAKASRSVKYAILIIALTFTIFFFIEIFQKRQIHPLQYILVGIALCVFYTLLLSVSEYLGFNIAYLVAATATVSLIGLYVLGIFKKWSTAGGFALALGSLYAYIFVLIQLQDYALIFGSIGLFVILAVIMYFSRKIDWYGPVKTN